MNRRNEEEFSMAGDVLRNLFEKIAPEEIRRSSQVFHGWEDIVGIETASHVFPIDIRNRSLLLESDHPGWSQKIRMRQEGILRAINRKYPELEIKSLKIRVSSGKKSHQAIPKKKEEPPEEPSSVYNNPRRDESDIGTHSEKDSEFLNLLEKMRRRADP